MMPNYMIENLKNNGVKVVLHDNILDLLKNVDIHYHTRPQFNIMKDDPNAPSESEIKTAFHDWRITIGVVNKVGESNLPYIMHPLPIDSKVSEIDIEVTFLPKQKYLYQAECGLFMRKALLKEILGGTNYIKFNGDMSFMSDLYDSNHIQRIIKNGEGPRETNPGDISPICYGMVIDHLDPGSIDKIKSDLGLDNQRINNTSRANADSPGNKPKGIVFVNDYYLTDKEMKQIAKISPNATFNVIRGGTIVEKFVYATCSNDNCISNQIFEEVPIIFENRGNTPSCHYCRKPSDTQYDRITPKEMQTFIETLAIK